MTAYTLFQAYNVCVRPLILILQSRDCSRRIGIKYRAQFFGPKRHVCIYEDLVEKHGKYIYFSAIFWSLIPQTCRLTQIFPLSFRFEMGITGTFSRLPSWLNMPIVIMGIFEDAHLLHMGPKNWALLTTCLYINHMLLAVLFTPYIYLFYGQCRNAHLTCSDCEFELSWRLYRRHKKTFTFEGKTAQCR